MIVFPKNSIEYPDTWVHADNESGYIRFFKVPEGEPFYSHFPFDEFSDEEKDVLRKAVEEYKSNKAVYSGLERINRHRWFIISLKDSGAIVIAGRNLFDAGVASVSLLRALQENSFYNASFVLTDEMEPFFLAFSTHVIKEHGGRISKEDSICTVDYICPEKYSPGVAEGQNNILHLSRENAHEEVTKR